MLFTGCIGEGLFSRVNEATTRVLETNGYEVEAPPNQVCCGALHAHAGDLDGARALARKNIEAFGERTRPRSLPMPAVAGRCWRLTGICFQATNLFREAAHRFSARIRDISQQLENAEVKQGAELSGETVTYDASCHLLYGQHATEAPLKLLRAIPNLNLVPLEGAERCCGAAGIYNLMEPNMSQGVLQEKLSRIRETGADVLTSGNPGCQMQIGAGAKLEGMSLRVCHPVELLDESYQRAGFYSESGDQRL